MLKMLENWRSMFPVLFILVDGDARNLHDDGRIADGQPGPRIFGGADRARLVTSFQSMTTFISMRSHRSFAQKIETGF